MNCAISQEQQKRFGTQVAKDVLASIEAGTPIDLKAYTQDIYNQVKEATNDPIRALDYARLVPVFLEQIATYDRDIKSALRGQGFSMDALADLVLNVSNETEGLVSVAEYLELHADIVAELREDNADRETEPEEEEEEEVPEDGDGLPPTTRTLFQNVGERINDYISRKFRAYAPTAMADRIQEALSWDRNSDQYNVPDPEQAFYFKVKRKIVEQLKDSSVDYDSSKMDLGGMGPVYLTAMAATQIDSADLRPGVDETSEAHQKGVVLALTDRYGMPFRFDEEGNPILTGGKPAYYYLRQTDNMIDAEGNVQLTGQDLKGIDAMAKQMQISKDAAAENYKRELQLIADMRKYVRENSENKVQSIINGGTMGYIERNYNLRTKINQINFGNNAFNPTTPRANDYSRGLIKGNTYFQVDGMYGQFVQIERPSIVASGHLEKVVSLITDTLTDPTGVPLNVATRRAHVDAYIKTGVEGIQIVNNPQVEGGHIVKIQGKALDMTNPEEVKAQVTKFLSTRGPARKIQKSQIGNRRVVQNLDNAQLNTVLEVKDPDGGASNYYMIDDQKLHVDITNLTGLFEDSVLTNNPDGTVAVDTESYRYKDFIKENFYILHPLNAENKLVKLNSYFTFQPMQSEIDKMYSTDVAEEVIEEAEESTPPTNEEGPADDSSDLTWDGPEFYKNLAQKGVDIKATKAQLKEAEKWYKEHPISKYIPLHVMFNAVNVKNPKVVASWAIHGITLFEGSDYSDVYHEAWHAFTQTFMTNEQRQKVYGEARKKSGSFTDYNGHRVSFKKATDLQIEEYLAEDFRKYMLNGQKEKASEPARNSFFKKIWNMLKALFGNSTVAEMASNERSDNSIREIFEKLRVGNLTEYTFNQENVQFGELNKGIQAWNEGEEVAGLSYENSLLVNNSIDSMFSEFLDLMNAGLNNQQIVDHGKRSVRYAQDLMTPEERKTFEAEVEGLKSKNTYKYTSQVYNDPRLLKGLYRHARIRLGMINNAMHERYEAMTDPVEKERLAKDLGVLNYAFRNFGDVETLAANTFAETEDIKGVMGYHMSKSKQYMNEKVLALDHEDMSEEDTFLKGRQGHDRLGNETSMMELADKEVLYLLKGIHKVDKQGNIVRNKWGVAELTPFQEIWNRLARTLQNQTKADVMEKLIRQESKHYAPFKQLLNRIGPNATESLKEAKLWSEFWQTFNLSRVPLVQMTVQKTTDRDNKVNYESRIGEAFADYKKIGKSWQSEFHLADHKKNKYINHDRNGNYLNIKAILEDFQVGQNAPVNKQLSGREFEFMTAMGYKFTDAEEIRKALKDGVAGAKWYRKRLVYLNNRGDIKVRNFTDLNDAYPAVNIGGRPFHPQNDMNTRSKQAQQLEARYSDKHSNYMVTNAENNTQFEHTLNNSLTIVVNAINNSKSYQDLIENPYMSHLDVKRNPFAKASTWLNSLYVLDVDPTDAEYGNRRRKSDELDSPFTELKLTNLSGVLLTEEDGDTGEGIASAKADEFTKLIMDFHMVTESGIPELMRHADKGTSYSVAIDGLIHTKSGVKSKHYIPTMEFLSDATFYNKKAVDALLPHIQAELERIGIMRDLAAGDVENFDFKYLKSGQNFVSFHGVLSPAVKEDLIALQMAGTPMEDIFDAEMMVRVTKDVSKYFNRLIERAEKRLGKADFITDSLYKATIKEANKNTPGSSPTRTDVKPALIKSFVYNSWIHNIESTILYGDMAQFKDFFKRNAGMGSTGRLYRTDQAMQDLANNVLGRAYAEKMGIEPYPYDGTFNTAVIRDNEIGSVYYDEYLKAVGDENAVNPYNKGNMNEGDAQGWITFDSYRIMKNAEGSWSDPQEELYQKIIKGEKFNHRDVTEFFPTVKAQYFGPLKTEGLPITAFHKYSLFPLIPSVIKGTNLENLHNKMMKEGIDYTTFESGSKVGTITKDSAERDEIYSKDRDITDKPFTKNQIFLEYLKDQLEIAPKYKGQVIFSTQMRKLIEDGLMENGVPTDFNPAGKNAMQRIEAWEAMTERQKLDKSKRYRLVKRYEDNIRKLTESKKEQLLKEVNWTREIVNGKEVLKGDIKDLMKFVKGELTRQDLGEHEIDFIEVGADGKLKHDLSLSLGAEKIEKLLNALVTKRLVKQKVNGESLVQVSGALFETAESKAGRNYTNPTAEELKKWGTNDLPTYRQGVVESKYTAKDKINIYAGTGENAELSNFAERGYMDPLGIEFKNVEAGFQYAKLTRARPTSAEDIAINDKIGMDLQSATGAQAKSLGRKIKGLDIKAWDKQSSAVMKSIIHDSFEQNPDALNILAATGQATLTHTQDRGKWGKEFPKLLMEVRDELVPPSTGGDGKTTAMKVKIALQGDFVNLLKATDKAGEQIRTVERLNELIRDDEWLDMGRNRELVTMVGVRIPVQGLNSMEFMEVYEFLPAEAGNIIVPPAEIVAKSGADFDIDKMTVIMPNLRKNGAMFNYTDQELRDVYKKYKDSKIEALSLKENEDAWLYDNFIATVFGVSAEELEEGIEDALLETGEIEDFDTFKERVLGSKAIENDILDNLKSILELPENYATLIRPNGVDILAPIAADLKQYVSEYDFTETVHGEVLRDDDSKPLESPTSAFEIDKILEVHSSNNIGKATLGLGAVDNTYNSIFNRIGARMNASKGISTAKYEALQAKTTNTKAEKKAMQNYRRQTLMMPHNSIEINGEDAISLSHVMGKDGNRISDVINQMINGWVDIAKDAWIFNIQGNKEIAPALLFMIQAGVPVKQAIYFVSQPMVREYVRQQRLTKSSFAEPLGKGIENPMFFRNKSREEILLNPKFGFDIPSSAVRGRVLGSTIKSYAENNVNTEFDEADLYSTIKKFSAEGDNYTFTDTDRQAFVHFLEIEDMSKAVRDIKLKMNFDTSKSGTLFEAQNRIRMKDALRYDERIPTAIVDDIINNSPIGSFYIQPFQLSLWKDAFKLRNHAALNDFLTEKFGEATTRDDVRNTFGDPEIFANEFRNDFINFMFQNSLKSFDTKSNAYRGRLVNGTVPAAVKKVVPVTSLKTGAFMKDGVLYTDKRQLNRDFENKEFTRAGYEARGLAKVSSLAFGTVGEYHHFVYEREHLRDAFPYSKAKDTVDYIQKRNVIGARNQKKTDETQEEFNTRLDKKAYEVFLRDMALDNIFNHWKLFRSQTTYAQQFDLLRTAHPELAEDFELVKQLSVGTSGAGYTNLKLNDNNLDGDMVNIYHENLTMLIDPTVIKVADPVANDRISEYFSKFPTVAFLQSGMSTKSAFSLTRVVPQDTFLRVISKSAKQYDTHFNAALRAKKTPQILEEYYSMFVAANGMQNRATRIRGKQYLTNFDLNASHKMLKDNKKRAEVIDPIIVTDPLQKLGAGLSGFNPVSITAEIANKLVVENPTKTYIYNYALDNQNNAFQQDRNFYGTGAPNTVGLPTRLKYAGGAASEQIKDVDGAVDPRVKAEIDAAIENMKQQKANGQTLVFSKNGYGQYMIGASDVARTKAVAEVKVAPKTFLYLSQRLYEEFDYINPNYLFTKTGKAVVQSSQPLSDQQVRDFMNHCM